MMAVQTDIQDFEGTIAYQIDTVNNLRLNMVGKRFSFRTLEIVQLSLSAKILLET